MILVKVALTAIIIGAVSFGIAIISADFEVSSTAVKAFVVTAVICVLTVIHCVIAAIWLYL